MKTPTFNTTVLFYPNKNPKLRLLALWYFTALMIVWNILGHTYLGFEQSWAAPFVGVGSAVLFQFLLEWVDAWAKNREMRFCRSASSTYTLPGTSAPSEICMMSVGSSSPRLASISSRENIASTAGALSRRARFAVTAAAPGS